MTYPPIWKLFQITNKLSNRSPLFIFVSEEEFIDLLFSEVQLIVIVLLDGVCVADVVILLRQKVLE